jgi:hypothetical protein
MATLERLVVELSANAQQFRAELAKVDTRLAAFEKSTVAHTQKVETAIGGLGAGFKRVQQGLAALGVVAGVRGLVNMTKAAIDQTSAMVDLSDRLGIGVEQYQKLRFAATQSGVSVESFNKSLDILNRTLGDAGKLKALEKLGIDTKALGGEPVTAIFSLADQMAKLDSQAQKAAVSQAAFGRGGAAMVNMLGQGSGQVRQYGDAAERTGQILKDKLAREAEEAGDKLDTAADAIKVKLTPALLALAPFLEKAAGGLSNLASWAQIAAAKFGDFLGVTQAAKGRAAVAELQDVNHELLRTQQHLDDVRAGGGLNGVINGLISGREAKQVEMLESDLAKLSARRKELQEQVTHPDPEPAKPKPTGDGAGPLGGKDGKDKEKTPKLSRSDRAARDAREEIDILRQQNDMIRAAVAVSTPLATINAQLLAIEQGRKTAVSALGVELGKLTEQQKALLDGAQKIDELRKQTQANARLKPQQDAILSDARSGKITPEDIEPMLQLAEHQDELRELFSNKGWSQETIDSVLAMGAATAAFARSQEQAKQATDFVVNTRRDVKEDTETLTAQHALLRAGIASGRDYHEVQQDMADAAERLRLAHQGLKLGASAEDLASVDALLLRYQTLQRQFERTDEAARKLAAFQHDIKESVKDGIADVANALLDMAKKGEFSFKRLEEAANRFVDSVTRKIIDRWTDQLIDWLFPKSPSSGGGGGGGGGGGFNLFSLFGGGGGSTTAASTTSSTQWQLSNPNNLNRPSPQSSSFLSAPALTLPTAAVAPTATALPAAAAPATATADSSPLLSSLSDTGGDILTSVGKLGSSILTDVGKLGGGILSGLGEMGGGLLKGLGSLFGGGGGAGGGGGFLSFLGGVGSLFGGGGGSSAAGAAGGANWQLFDPSMMNVPFMHQGGPVGFGGTRPAPAGLFLNAPRYHRGGLAHDEVPAILQTGELVLSRAQTQAAQRGGSAPATAEGVVLDKIGALGGDILTRLDTHSSGILNTVGATGTGVVTQLGDTGSGVVTKLGDTGDGMLKGMGSLGSGLLGGLGSLLGGGGGGGGLGGGLMSFGGLGGGSGMGGLSGLIGATTQGDPSQMFGFAGILGKKLFHDGGEVGPTGSRRRLAIDEVPAILQTGETVLSRAQTRAMHASGRAEMQSAPVINMTINTPDANSFRRNQSQIHAQMYTAAQRATRRDR